VSLTLRDLEVYGIYPTDHNSSCLEDLLRAEIPVEYRNLQLTRWFDTPDPNDEKTPDGVPDPRLGGDRWRI